MSDAQFWGAALIAGIALGALVNLADYAWTRLQLWAGAVVEGHVTAALGEDTSVTAEAERITRTAVS